jgi:hypothetical protein
VVHAWRSGAHAHVLIRTNGDNGNDPVPPGWAERAVTLEELTLAYLREPGAVALSGSSGRQAEPWEMTK